MSEFEEKLESILGNPQAMEQIMSLAQSLGTGSSSSPTPCDTEPRSEPNVPSSPLDGFGLGKLDPQLLTGVAQLLAQSQSNDDERVALLQALRPFVKEQRYAKLDKAIQIARLSRLIRMALELFRTKEDSHV